MQDITLSHTSFNDEKICGHVVLTSSQELIGTYEFYVKECSFISAINIFSDFQNKGIGFYIFQSCFNELNKKSNLKYFIASWSLDKEYLHLPKQQSTNLTKFLDLLNNGDDEKKALWGTPTGKWLKKIGFTDAIVTHKDSENVKALFTKYT